MLIKRCCICNKLFIGSGNDAHPVKNGLCCNKCNKDVEVARVENLHKLAKAINKYFDYCMTTTEICDKSINDFMEE